MFNFKTFKMGYPEYEMPINGHPGPNSPIGIPGRRIRPIGTLGRLFALPSPSRRLAGGGVAGKMSVERSAKKTHKRPIGIVNLPALNGNQFFWDDKTAVSSFGICELRI